MTFSAFPFVRYFLFLAAGIVGYILSNFFDVAFYYLLIGFLLGVLLTIRYPKPQLRGFLMLSFVFLFGWVLAYQKTVINNPNHFLHQANFTYYQAIISSNAEVKPKTYKTEANIFAIKNGKWQATEGKVLLYFNKDEAPKPQYGDIFLLKGMPRWIEGPKNPQEFDYRRFLQYRGLYAHHFLWNGTFQKIGHQVPSKILDLAFRANNYADSVYKAQIKTPNEYAVAEAMVVGLRDEIDSDLLNAYSASGAVHVLSVSGMHVGILFLVLGYLFAWLKKLKRGNLWFVVVILSILWVYAIFTGLTPTVLRATVMFSIIQIATAINRKQNIYNTLAVSAIILLCWNPYWLLDVGFQLSYLAIIGIVYLHPYLNQLLTPKTWLGRNVWEISVVSFAAQVFTFPLSVYYFHQFPTYFLVANPFVAAFSFLVLPLGLALLFFSFVPILSNILTFFLKWSLVLLNQTAFLVEKLPISTLKGFSISGFEMIAMYALVLWLIAFFFQSNLKYLQGAFLLLCGMAIWNIFEDHQQNRQQQITLHFIPKKSGISVIEGKRASFIADSSLINNPKIYGFHLKNYFDFNGINEVKLIDIKDFTSNKGMTVVNFDDKQIFWMRQKFKGTIKGKADYVLISNNAVRQLHPTFKNFEVKQIIVDDSNKKYVVESLKHQADSLHIKLISLYDNGAVML